MKRLINFEAILLLIGGLFLWNTWVFGFLNHGVAGYTQMSISELNVPGQPYASFFSITEGLSGFFLLFSGLALIATIRKGVFLIVALSLIALIGALTIFDATHPDDCSPYQNPVCATKMNDGQVSATEKAHGIESIITDYATVSLALFLMLWVGVRKLTGEDVVLVEIGSIVILGVGLILTRIIPTHDVSVGSLVQRTWNTLVSLEFLYVEYRVKTLMRKE
jgi:hypothetical protein